MHERAQLCQDPQTEFALLRESLGVSRVNNILRFHGHTILQEQWAAEIYDEVGQRSLERRLIAVIETATSTYLTALDDEDQGCGKVVYPESSSADEAWQHTIGGLQEPGVTNPTIASTRTSRLRISRCRQR